MWWQDFHFLRPFWLVGLIVPLLLGLKFFYRSETQSDWSNVCDKNLLDFLLVKTKTSSKHWLKLAAIFFTTTLIVALSGPTWSKKNNPALSVNNPLTLMLSMSGDMWRKDVSPNRFIRAKYLIKDLTESLKNTESGLIVYTDEPFMITPLTEDVSIIDNLLPAIEMNIVPQDGDRLDRAIDFAVERMKNAAFVNGSIIVLASDVGERFDAALSSAAKAAADGFSVNIINVSAATNDKLKIVTEKGLGIYLNYNQNLEPLIKKINDITAREIKQSQNIQTVWNDMGWYFLWLPALLILIWFRRGILVLIFSVLLAEPVSAGWFMNNNQEAMAEFKRQNYAKAAEQFENMQWKGAAAYKNGDYQTAYANFSQQNDVTSLYNQGNALAKAGKIDEAIKKYEEVLQKQADFADAKFNLEYLKQQKQQQKQQNTQDNQQEQNKQQNKQQSPENQTGENQKKEQPQNQQQSGQSEQNKNKQTQADEMSQSSEQKQEQQENNNLQENHSETKNQQQQTETDEKQSSSNKSNQSDTPKNKSGKTVENRENELETAKNSPSEENENKQVESIGVNDEKTPEEKEKLQAKMQKFREIPEDKGGLLRAFIQREYNKKRYKN